MKDKNGRIEWADTARGIAILCVILGHMNISKYLEYIIFSFHMPVFFLLGGYFLKPGDNKSFIVKKAKHLLIPYAFTCICIIILSQIPYLTGKISDIEYIQPESSTLINQIKASLLGSGDRKDFLWIRAEAYVGAIWFLLALFWDQIIINFVIQTHIPYIFIYVFAVIGIISSMFFWLPLSIQSAAAGAVFVTIGYKFSGKDIGRIIDNKKIMLLCFILWGIYLCLCFYFDTRLSLASARFPFGPLDFICPTAASVVVFRISHRLMPRIPKLKDLLSWLGKNSLVVLCFHLLELKWIPLGETVSFYLELAGVENKLICGIFIYIAKILWACCAVLLVKRITLLRHIFGYPDIKNKKALQG